MKDARGPVNKAVQPTVKATTSQRRAGSRKADSATHSAAAKKTQKDVVNTRKRKKLPSKNRDLVAASNPNRDGYRHNSKSLKNSNKSPLRAPQIKKRAPAKGKPVKMIYMKVKGKKVLVPRYKVSDASRRRYLLTRTLYQWEIIGGKLVKKLREINLASTPLFDKGFSESKQLLAHWRNEWRIKRKEQHRLARLRGKMPLDSLVRPVSLTVNRVLGRSKKFKPFPWKYGRNVDEKYFDTSFGQDMIDSKKRRFHMFKFNPISRKSIDLNPRKFFFYKMKKDPVYNSFLLEKIISVFSKHGRKSAVRKVFYKIFLTDKYDYNIQTLYSVIGDLRPLYINVPVRMANRYYYAPIRASPMRSTMRAIRFFKMAVLSNKHEKNLEGKILAELENTFEFLGYVNSFYHDYVTMSENNKYLAHFRKRRII